MLATPAISIGRIKPTWTWAADNGCFGKGWPGEDKWIAWLDSFTEEQKASCLFATLPDVVGDAEATLHRSLPLIDAVRELGYQPALVTQDGMTEQMIPWDRIGYLFIGGSDAHKMGEEAASLIQAALARDVPVHVGRVNSGKRFERFAALGCHTCDGTFLAFGPDANLPRLLSWVEKVNTHEPLFEMTK